LLERLSQLAIGCDSAGDKQRGRSSFQRGFQGLRHEVIDHRSLERRYEVERFLIANSFVVVNGWRLDGKQSCTTLFDRGLHIVCLDVTQHRGFDPAIREVEALVCACEGLFARTLCIAVSTLELRQREADCFWIAKLRKSIDDRSTGIAESEKLSDFVEGFACSVIASVTDVAILPRVSDLLGEIEVRVSAAHDQREHREFQIAIASLPLLEEHCVNVSFEMIDGDERLVGSEGQGFCVADSDQQCAGESWTLGDGDSVELIERHIGLAQRSANDGNDVAQVLARSEFRHYSAERLMRGDLRSDHRRDEALAALDDGSGRLIARTLDGQDVRQWSHCFYGNGKNVESRSLKIARGI
jgi:hypothetical protein